MEKFLVQIRFHGDPETYASLMTGNQIIDRVGMYDCYDEELKVYRITEFGNIEEIKVYGTWHDMKNPLYIKGVDSKGEIVFDGFGTDH